MIQLLWLKPALLAWHSSGGGDSCLVNVGMSGFAVIHGLGAGNLGLVANDVRKRNASKLFRWEICLMAPLLTLTVTRNTYMCLGMGVG